MSWTTVSSLSNFKWKNITKLKFITYLFYRHEIGDFAVLRRAGVSLKRALVFNVVSGILCMLGVLIGLLIGSNESLKNWAFLFIAGTFLYISLVDMVSNSAWKKNIKFNFKIYS